MKLKSTADVYTLLLQNFPGLTVERIAQMSDDQKILHLRRLEEDDPNKPEALTPKQACINRWVGKGMSYEAALERWQKSMGDRDG